MKEKKRGIDYSMYLTIEKTAEYLNVPVSEVYRLIREKQVRTIQVDDELLLNKE